MKTGIIKKAVNDVANCATKLIDDARKDFIDAEIIEEDSSEKQLEFRPKFPDNYEQKCPVVLVIDKSGSISVAIDELNNALHKFQTQILNDPTASERIDCSVVSFSSDVKIERKFSLMDKEKMPTLHASGTTKLVNGVFEGMAQMVARKKWYDDTGQTRFCGFIILITDGAPDRDQNIKALKKAIQEGFEDRKFIFWAFGVKGANMNLLHDLAHEGSIVAELNGYDFASAFDYISRSTSGYSKSRTDENIDLSPKKGEFKNFQMKVY